MSENTTLGAARIDWQQEIESLDGLMDENGITYDHHEPAGMYRDLARRIAMRFLELVPVVEAVASKEPLWANDEFDIGGCIYCDGSKWNDSGLIDAGPECTQENKPPHAPDCPYRRARELCGKDDV